MIKNSQRSYNFPPPSGNSICWFQDVTFYFMSNGSFHILSELINHMNRLFVTCLVSLVILKLRTIKSYYLELCI